MVHLDSVRSIVIRSRECLDISRVMGKQASSAGREDLRQYLLGLFDALTKVKTLKA